LKFDQELKSLKFDQELESLKLDQELEAERAVMAETCSLPSRTVIPGRS
jgi:hypothetical protein